jgi:hypothetical protein
MSRFLEAEKHFCYLVYVLKSVSSKRLLAHKHMSIESRQASIEQGMPTAGMLPGESPEKEAGETKRKSSDLNGPGSNGSFAP